MTSRRAAHGSSLGLVPLAAFATVVAAWEPTPTTQKSPVGVFSALVQDLDGRRATQVYAVTIESRGESFQVGGVLHESGTILANLGGTYYASSKTLRATMRLASDSSKQYTVDGSYDTKLDCLVLKIANPATGRTLKMDAFRIDPEKIAGTYFAEDSQLTIARRGDQFQISGRTDDGESFSGTYYLKSNRVAGYLTRNARRLRVDGAIIPELNKLHLEIESDSGEPTRLELSRALPKPAELPSVLSISESSEDFGTWSCKWEWNGSFYEGTWPNGTKSEFRIESGSGKNVFIRRKDTAGPSKGLTGDYEGSIVGKRIEGTCTWTFSGWNPRPTRSGKWWASW